MAEWSTPAPTRLGRYTLLGKLARGGMAELFLAKSEGIEGFEKIVVLKRILPSFAEDAEFIELFISEARLAAQLDHANIVHVHDIGRDGSDFFFTMEYLHGHDVRHLLNEARRRDHRLPLQFVLAIVARAAEGLHHAHKQVDFSGQPLGIVHRDVSPSNIFITYSGHVKMVDFGIAKAAALSRASRASSLKGKVAYMSPEQCRGGTVDCRSDVFALGLVLYELLTNRAAFAGLDHVEALHAVAAGRVTPIEEKWPECPSGLRAILARALQPDPEQRYRTALELLRDLERFAHDNRLMLSSAELGDFLEAVFGKKRLPWLEPDAETKPVVVGPLSMASPTVDKRREAGLSGGTRVATMLAPEPTPSAEAEPAQSNTFVGHGSETSISLDPAESIDAEPPARSGWPRVLGGAAAAAGLAGALWASGVVGPRADSIAPVASPSPASDAAAAAPNTAATLEPAAAVAAEPPPEAMAEPMPVEPPAGGGEDAQVPASDPSAAPSHDLAAAAEPAKPEPPAAKATRKPRKKPRPKVKPKPDVEPKPKSDPNGLLPY